MSDESQQIALDPVAMHLNRKAKFFENEALILASQVRDLLAIVQAAPQVVADDEPEPLGDEPSPDIPV